MPKKDNNMLFKRIIYRRYKRDEIRSTLLFYRRIDFLFKNRKIFEEDVVILTELFSEKINLWLEKEQIFEENVLNLTELFTEKMNINDRLSKVITIARLLKNVDDLNSVYENIRWTSSALFSCW